MWNSNFDLFNLFFNKTIILENEDEIKTICEIRLPTLKEMLEIREISCFINCFEKDLKEIQTVLFFWKNEIENKFDALKVLLFKAGHYSNYDSFVKRIIEGLKFIVPDLIIRDKKIFIDDYELDKDLFDYILYLILRSQGRECSPPIFYKTEEEKKLAEELKKNEDRIAKIKREGKRALKDGKVNNDDLLLSTFLTITYIFPNFTFDFLYEQTLAQISWLHKKAAKAISYDIQSQAYAAGNLKKIKFFLEE